MENRKIKFRAWDKKNKYMISWEIIGGFVIRDFLTNMFFIPMQYTNLNDKNDKEIYEGDIVKYTQETSDGYFSSHKPREIKFISAVNFTGFNIGRGRLKTNNFKMLEIIGNIYENKELKL